MLQLTSFTQKLSLLLVLSLLSTLVPAKPLAFSATGQTAAAHSPGFTFPLPTPAPELQTVSFTSPLPTPPAPAPTLG